MTKKKLAHHHLTPWRPNVNKTLQLGWPKNRTGAAHTHTRTHQQKKRLRLQRMQLEIVLLTVDDGPASARIQRLLARFDTFAALGSHNRRTRERAWRQHVCTDIVT